MANSQTQDEGTQDWDAFIEEANEELLAAFERNVESQANFVEAWVDAIEEASDVDHLEDAAEGYAKAYQVWMQAAAEQTDRMNSMMSGEDVSLESFRDGWLNAANEAFQEAMATTAFAATTGETVENVLDLKRETDEYAEDTLHALRFATLGDVQEVGKRLVEVERRLQTIEEQQEAILDNLES